MMKNIKDFGKMIKRMVMENSYLKNNYFKGIGKMILSKVKVI
jgi:hypothetical protein